MVELHDKYVGQVLLDDEECPAVLRKVVDITFGDIAGPAYWEATCIPVERNRDGSYRVPKEHVLASDGAETYRPKSLWGCVLVSFAGGSATKMPYVDELIAARVAAGL